MRLDLGLSNKFEHEFVISEISVPILGADFLYKFGLVPDLRNKRLIEADSKLFINVVSANKNATPTPRLLALNNEFGKILNEFPSLTAEPNFHIMPKHNVIHRIYTRGPLPYSKPRRLTADRYKIAKDEFDKMIQLGICRISNSQTSSPLTLASKTRSSDLRPCGDYRKLNYLTIPDRYPLPLVQDFNSNIKNAKIFSKVDIVRAYHFIPIAEEDVYKTAITTPFGLYEFTRMPFGLRNAAQSFQRFMNEVTKGLDFVFVYMDDILVFSDSEEQHKQHLRQLFRRLEQFGLQIKPIKCLFGVKQLEFLGHDITEQGIKPSASRVQAIVDFETPTSLRKLQKFIGMVNYYFRFIPNLAKILIPLHDYVASCTKISKKSQIKTSFHWTDECKQAFEKAKQGLIDAVLLAHPSCVHSRISLVTDASNVAVGSVLQQKVNNVWQPLGFFSKKLKKPEQKYSTVDRELLAVYLSIKHFRFFLEGRQFTVFTDHKPLVNLINSTTEKSPRQTTHLNYIAQFTSDIRHIRGSENVVADFLSRIPEVDSIDRRPTKQSYICELNEPIHLQDILNSQSNDAEITRIIKTKRLNSRVIFEQIAVPNSTNFIWCEVSNFVQRPYIPKPLRFKIFHTLHSLSHPGVKATRKLINRRYFWPKMNTDVGRWTKECISCQRTKVHRHTKSPVEQFPLPRKRFDHIHIDLVGPLPISNNYTHVLTVVDRYTRWPEAYPLRNTTAQDIVRCLIKNYVSRFGIPSIITTDRGSQFEAKLFYEWCNQLGTTRTRTTAYHPQANGMVERFHRTLKAAITAKCNKRNWCDVLPLILLGLRTTIKEDLHCSPAELVYGENLVIPGEYTVSCSEGNNVSPSEFAERLKEYINTFRPIQTPIRGTQKSYIPCDLNTCSHVLVRIDELIPSLSFKYNGPYKVIKRLRKFFIIDIDGKNTSVTIDRLKPFYGSVLT